MGRMPGTGSRQRKKMRFQAASLPSRDTATVKDEMMDDDGDHPKPYAAPNVQLQPGHCAVKVETGQETEHNQKQWRPSRYSYLMSISQRIKSSPTDEVFGADQKVFHNVFKCLTDAIVASQKQADTEEKVTEVSINSDAFDPLAPLAGREYYLEKLLALLLCMACLRVYDPPSDSEIIYYREIKKHIRCMIAYNEAKGSTKDTQCADSKDTASYHRTSVSQTISAVEELIELKGTLAEINTHIWDLNHKNDKSKPISINRRQNRERDTMDTMLCSPGGIDGTNGLFDGRLFEYVDELRRSCLSFMRKVTERLGTVVYPENLHRRFGKDSEGIINHLANTQKVRPANSPDYIEGIDQYILLARYASSLIKGTSSSVKDAFANLTDMLQRKHHWSEFAPEALRVLLLLDSGAFRKAGDKMEIPLPGIKTTGNVVISLGSSTDNLKVVATILQILKDIGTLDAFVAPSRGEMVLLEQILEHVSLCIDGFLSTTAYHKERELNLAPASTLVPRLLSLREHGMFRGMPAAYFHYGGKYLVESLFQRFELVQEDIDL